MSLKSEHEDLVISIDQQVTQILLNNGDSAEVLLSVANRMHEIRKLMDSAPEQEMDFYCDRYDGFYLLMTFLKDMAEAISTGRVYVATYH